MAYEFETQSFSKFAERLRDFPDPEGIPKDRELLKEMSELYLSAMGARFHLMLLIMKARFEKSERGTRYEGFIVIYDDRVRALIDEMQAFLFEGLELDDVTSVHEFLEGVRRGSVPFELEALQFAIDQSSGEGPDLDADETAGTTVTNSLKEQIERRVSRKFIKDILHAINEVLAVARGVT